MADQDEIPTQQRKRAVSEADRKLQEFLWSELTEKRLDDDWDTLRGIRRKQTQPESHFGLNPAYWAVAAVLVFGVSIWFFFVSSGFFAGSAGVLESVAFVVVSTCGVAFGSAFCSTCGVAFGKVRFVGCSTHPAWMVMEALAIAERDGLPRYVSEQPPYNLLDRRVENELLPLCRKYDLAVLPWSPLGGGILANRYADGVPDGSRATRRPQLLDRVTTRAVEVGRELAALAADRGLTATQLALLWCKDQPGVTAPIIGPRTMEQLDDALPVLTMTLDEETRAACDELVPPGSAVADFHNTAPWMRARLTA
jgi:hypothetical protein